MCVAIIPTHLSGTYLILRIFKLDLKKKNFYRSACKAFIILVRI